MKCLYNIGKKQGPYKDIVSYQNLCFCTLYKGYVLEETDCIKCHNFKNDNNINVEKFLKMIII